MKKIIFSSAAAALLLFAACTKSQPETPREFEPREVMGMVQNSFAVIVDIREPEERTEVIVSAVAIPYSQIEKDEAAWKDFVSKTPKDKTVVFHCESGSRAQRAAEKLAAAGFKTGYFGGVDTWKEAGLPATKGPAKPQ